MEKIKIKVSHKDKRGLITDLLEKQNINAITLITQKKGSIRGNHFHKKTIQWNYVLKGKLELYTQKKNEKLKKTVLSKGELAVTVKNEAHAIIALQNTEFLVFTEGPRGGKEYENDTFRLKNSLV
jgi:quercetin dioxygenase-like cupin family protein|tara:strand:- start:85 stop:459 length:375 start_codon:yes stop_codon:yes gene_type:complete